MAGQGFREELTQLLQARYPLLVVETHEEQRVLREIRAVAEDQQRLRTPRRVYVWSSITGLAPAGGPPIAETRAASAALERVYGWAEPAVFVFVDLHPSLVSEGGHRPDPEVVRRLRELAATFKTRPVPLSLILVSPSLPVPSELEHDATVIDFPLPDQRQIGELLDGMVAAHRQQGPHQHHRDDRDMFVAAARGLTLPEAENAFARALVEGGGLDPSDLELILAEKRQAVRRSGMLDIVPRRSASTPSAASNRLKSWLTKRSGTWTPRPRPYNLRAPKGLLLTGVPGCGKSLSAVCVASMWRLPLLRLDLGRVFAGLVGSSEKNMRTVIRTAEGIAPCVLWVDEIEKGLAGAGGGGDGGTARARVRHVPVVDAGEDRAGVRDGHREPGRLAAAGVPAQGPVRRDLLRRPALGARARGDLADPPAPARSPTSSWAASCGWTTRCSPSLPSAATATAAPRSSRPCCPGWSTRSRRSGRCAGTTWCTR